MMNLDAAKTAVGKLLTETGVTAVYYVDDKFQEDQQIEDRLEEFLIAIRERHAEGRMDDIPNERVRIAPSPENIDDEVRRWWSEMSIPIKQRMLVQYVDEDTDNARPAILIKDIFGEKCMCCSPSEWDTTHKDVALERIRQNKLTLLLFDHDLSNKRTGTQYAENALVAVADDADFAYCGIISQEFSIDAEFEKRVAYKKAQPNHYIYPLSKHRIPTSEEDYTLFVAGLKNVLWVKHIESLKKQTEDVFERAFHNTIKRYSDLQPPAYKKIIFDSSQKEGCREIDTTLRVIQIILDQEVKKAISDDVLSGINKESNGIHKIHDAEINSQPEVDKQAKELLKDERFLEGSLINRLHTPLHNGDIFKKGRDLYVLLCQPCNISIRSDGKRGANGYDTGFLVKLDETTGTGNKMCVSLDFEINGREYVAKLNDFKTVSLSILDNVVFNIDGKAIINFGQALIPEGLHRNLIIRKGEIEKQFKIFTKIKQNAGELCGECQRIIDMRSVLSSLSKDIKLEYIESDKITLPIQRIGHYRQPYSDDLLRQFSHNISRAGFPHPFI